MGHHSSPAVTKPISASEVLTEKLQQMKGCLQAQLARDFRRLLGVDLPDPSAAALSAQDYDLISTQTSIQSVVSGYDSGAEALIPEHITSAALQHAAQTVVHSVLGYVADQGQICAGGYACSGLTRADERAWVSSVFCEVEYCRGSDWSTPVDFSIICFAFVVWQLPPGAAQAADAIASNFGNYQALHWT